jgi:hypothetical protein
MNFRIFIRKKLPGDGNFTREFCIQDGFSGLKELELIEPKLHMTKSAAGSFECTFHKDSVVYKSNANDGKPWVEMGKTRVIVRRYKDKFDDGETMWEGRILSVNYDFYGQEHIYAEGALSYLNDSIQPIQTYKLSAPNYGKNASYYIMQALLANHNASCPDKKIEMQEMGKMTNKDLLPTEPLNDIKELTFGNETTMSAVSKMISAFGGNMRIIYDGNDAKLEWYKTGAPFFQTDYTPDTKIAQIIFTENMLDCERKRDLTSLVSYVYPRGYKAYSAGDYAVGDDMMLPMEDTDWCRVTWTTGAYIHTVSDQQGAVYEWVLSDGDYHDTMATGFYKSLRAVGPEGVYPNQDPRRRVDPDDPNSQVADTLEVHPGEYYYITLTQSNSRTCYIVTANDLGTNPAYILASQSASSSDYPSSQTEPDRYGQVQVTYPTTWRYQKIQIPTDDKIPDDWKEKENGVIKTDADGKPIYNKKFYLNVSSRGTFNKTGVDLGKDGTYSYLFDDAGNRKVGIWKGRYIPADEYITLKGLGDGSYDIFFATVSGTSVPLKMESQAGKDREILYPKSVDTIVVDDISGRPAVTNPEDICYVKNTNERWVFNHEHTWELCAKDKAEELSGIQAKKGSTWFVREDNSWWVAQVDTDKNRDINSWLRQKTFHRDGYYIYMDSLKSQYGRIEKFIDYSNVVNPDTLEDCGLAYLYTSEFESLNLTVKAVDLAVINPDYSNVLMFEVLGQVQVTSTYHGISDAFYIQEIEYDFADLGNTTIEVGYSKVLRITDTTKDLVKFG